MKLQNSKEKIETILKSFDAGLNTELIAQITNIPETEVIKILRGHGRME